MIGYMCNILVEKIDKALDSEIKEQVERAIFLSQGGMLDILKGQGYENLFFEVKQISKDAFPYQLGNENTIAFSVYIPSCYRLSDSWAEESFNGLNDLRFKLKAATNPIQLQIY